MGAEVVVVGAGPAGAAAAISLARAGRRVTVVDRATFPRDKCCGDGLTASALRRLEELGLDPAAVPSWQPVAEVVLRSPSGRQVTFPLPPGPGSWAAVARRSELDAALVDRARAAGAEVLEGRAVVGVRAGDGGVAVELSDGRELGSHYLVAADGMWSPVRKLLHGAERAPYLGEWHAFRQYFRDVGPAARRLHVWFEPDLLPGYAWSFPLPDGRANVGFGVRREAGRTTGEMSGLWPDLLARRHIADVLGPAARAEAPHRAWPIPAAVESATLSAGGGRVLFAGDAARATDPLTGEGIGQALETGVLAAEAIAAAGATRPDIAAGRYAAAVRSALVADHRLADLLSRALSHRKGVRAAVRIAGTSAWTRRNFARWLFEDYPRAVLLTPARWGRHVLAGPGAYAG